MSRRSVGVILLAVCSLALGVLAGLQYFHLFEITVPPAVLTDFIKSTARWAYITYGLITAGLLFVWSLLVALIAPLFRRKPAPKPIPAAAPPANDDSPRS